MSKTVTAFGFSYGYRLTAFGLFYNSFLSANMIMVIEQDRSNYFILCFEVSHIYSYGTVKGRRITKQNKKEEKFYRT
jgi:formate hydrogenlyase subunit 3/multisubunit Na+/H+ antiporter MnhD subunit